LEIFLFGDAITINELQENKNNEEFIYSHFINLEKYFEKYDVINLNKKQLKLFLNGVVLNIKGNDGTYRIKSGGVLTGTGILENNKLKRDIIINEV